MKHYLKRVFFVLILFWLIPFDNVYADSIYGYDGKISEFYASIGHGYDFDEVIEKEINLYFRSKEMSLSKAKKVSLPDNFKIYDKYIVYTPALEVGDGLSNGGPITLYFENAAIGESGMMYDVKLTLSGITVENICGSGGIDYPTESVAIMRGYSGKFSHMAQTIMENSEGRQACIGVSYTTTVNIIPTSGGEVKDNNMGIKFTDLDRQDRSKEKNADGGYSGSYFYVEGVRFNADQIGNIYIPKNPDSQLQYSLNGSNVRIFASQKDDDDFHSSFSAIANANGFQYEWSGSGGCETDFGIIIKTPTDIGKNLTVHTCSPKSVNGICGDNAITDSTKKEEKLGNYTGISNLIKRYITITHDSCKEKTVSASVYVKTENNVYMIDNGGPKAVSCAPVTLRIPVVIGENIDFNLGKLVGANGESSVYAGGGFKWRYNNDISVVQKNTLHLNYKYLLNDTDPMFHVTYGYSKFVGNDYEKVSDDDTFYRTLIDFNGKIYADESCSSEISLDDLVWNDVENKDYTLDKKFKSIDNNDKNKTTLMGLDVDKEFNNHVMTLIAKLKNAWIKGQGSSVTYLDKSDDPNYVSDGRVWHVPLKYSLKSVSVYADGIDISIIKDNDLKFSASCSIEVKNLVYDDKKFKPNYRPIDVSSPFNGKRKSQIESTAENWADWYCGDDEVCNPYDGETNLNQKRISNSYSLYPDSPLYRAIINNENARYISSLDTHYSSFDGINPDGSSDLVRNSSIFIIDRASNASERSFCGLGVYDESGSCDKYRNG